MDSAVDTTPCCVVGCPIRRRWVHRLVAAPPTHFGAHPVLHRPWTPRHPPCPLLRFTGASSTRARSKINGCPQQKYAVSITQVMEFPLLSLLLFMCTPPRQEV